MKQNIYFFFFLFFATFCVLISPQLSFLYFTYLIFKQIFSFYVREIKFISFYLNRHRNIKKSTTLIKPNIKHKYFQNYFLNYLYNFLPC